MRLKEYETALIVTAWFVVIAMYCGCGTMANYIRANQADECECSGKVRIDSTVPRAFGVLKCDCIGDRVFQFDTSGRMSEAEGK